MKMRKVSAGRLIFSFTARWFIQMCSSLYAGIGLIQSFLWLLHHAAVINCSNLNLYDACIRRYDIDRKIWSSVSESQRSDLLQMKLLIWGSFLIQLKFTLVHTEFRFSGYYKHVNNNFFIKKSLFWKRRSQQVGVLAFFIQGSFPVLKNSTKRKEPLTEYLCHQYTVSK